MDGVKAKRAGCAPARPVGMGLRRSGPVWSRAAGSRWWSPCWNRW